MLNLVKTSLVRGIVLVILLGAAWHASAQNAAAENAAMNFVNRLDVADPAGLYDAEFGPTFKQAVKKDIFVANTGMLKIQAGGPAQARQMVGGQAFTQTPTGQTGTFYYVRFKTKFPSGLVFQDVYLEQAGGAWKVAGFWVLPAPPN